jgi:hypothetical protein
MTGDEPLHTGFQQKICCVVIFLSFRNCPTPKSPPSSLMNNDGL